MIGQDELDVVLSEFYTTHVGQAARMQDMVDLIEERAPETDRAAIEALVDDWLLSFDCPENYAARCRTHGN